LAQLKPVSSAPWVTSTGMVSFDMNIGHGAMLGGF
jgi:hypothetical protein